MASSVKLFTLVMLRRRSNEILLGLKKRGFAKGKWNGFGGKVDIGESIDAAAHRELHEECGLRCTDLLKIGVCDFEFVDQPEIMQVHVFVGSQFEGELTESEEMKPHWFNIDEVPSDHMWPDDAYWWPYMLENKKFKAYFLYDNNENILRHKIDEVPDE